MNAWNVALRVCAKTACVSPTVESAPLAGCTRRASLSPNPSTRVVLTPIHAAVVFNSMKSVYWLVSEPRWKTIRAAEMTGTSTYCCSAIEWVTPLKVQ
jgi:hypothetical protein